MQSPMINKIADPQQSQYMINVAQKKKNITKLLDKNKIFPNNKSIIKPLILNQPNIKNVKKQKKIIRNTRRRNSEAENENQPKDNTRTKEENVIEEPNNSIKIPASKENENKINNESNEQSKNNEMTVDGESKVNINKSTEKPISSTKKKMTEIQMLDPEDKFSIVKEANNLFPKISLSQLLSASPSLRKELEHRCKSRVNKILCSLSNINIPLIIGEIEGKPLKILYDTGANVNIITTEGLNKLVNKEIEEDKNEQNITFANGTTVPTKFFVTLKININNSCTVREKFFIINQNNPYFDIIFGRSIQKKYRLLIDPDDDHIYQKTKKGLKKITNIIIDTEKNNTPLMNTIFIFKEEKQEFDNTLEEILNSVPKGVKSKFQELINQYKDCMATSMTQLSTANLEPHAIITITNKPIKLKPYKLSKEHSDILKNEIISLLEKGLITPSHSPWSFPVLLVQKKNGKWRMCIDYRKLNEITIKDSYALPFIDELISSVKGAKIFSALDLYSGYHQIPMKPEDIEKTSFTTKFGNYNFKLMPFGLTNAPATFQREMNRILLPLIGNCLFVYINDIVVYSKSPEEHLKHLQQVFEIFSKYNLSLNLQKCKFFQEQVEVLSHVLSSTGLKTMPSKVQTIALWDTPKDVNDLRSFLGLASYYRKFIQNFSMIADPLFQLLKKNQEYN